MLSLVITLPDLLGESNPITQFRKWIVPHEIIMEGAEAGRQFRDQCAPAVGEVAWITWRAALPYFDKMAKVANQPAASNAHFVWPRGFNIAKFSYSGEQGREICPCVAS